APVEQTSAPVEQTSAPVEESTDVQESTVDQAVTTDVGQQTSAAQQTTETQQTSEAQAVSSNEAQPTETQMGTSDAGQTTGSVKRQMAMGTTYNGTADIDDMYYNNQYYRVFLQDHADRDRFVYVHINNLGSEMITAAVSAYGVQTNYSES